MTPTTPDDLAEWRSRMAEALRASFEAMDAQRPSNKTVEWERRLRALEEEGRSKGFWRLGGHG